MPPSQKSNAKSPTDNHRVLIRRGLAIVLKRREPNGVAKKKSFRSRKDSSSASMEHERGSEGPPDEPDLGPDIFADLTKENSECYWNPSLVQSVRNLEYKGFVRPSTLLVGGTEYSLEVIRSAWGRRMLRPPTGYHIHMLGDLDPVTMSLVAQTQFAPLPEALCKVVYDLTCEGAIASLSVIGRRLKTTFPEIIVPCDDILYRALGTLIRERKLYHTGHGYSVVTPDTFRLLAMSPPLERQMLLTNEEAIVRLHGASYALDDGRTACTQTKDALTAWSSAERIMEPRKSGFRLKRCHSLKLLRSKDKEKLSRNNSFKNAGGNPVGNRDSKSEPENVDPNKKDKPSSMFSKWFRRGRSEKNRSKTLPKGTSFSTQFPPRDWSDPDFVHFNSRATQTLERQTEHRSKIRSSSLNRTSSKDRHSQHLPSTPVTPRAIHRKAYHQSADIYHYRSASLPRKTSSPSPKHNGHQQQIPEKPASPKAANRFRPTPQRPSTEPTTPVRPRYESPFSLVTSRNRGTSLLMANEKYGDVVPSRNSSLLQTGNVLPYNSASSFMSSTLKSPTHVLRKSDPAPTWRRPMSLTPDIFQPKIGIGEPIKKPPVVLIPRLTLPREVASVPPTKTTIKTDDTKPSEGLTKFIANGKELRLGTTVDVEISMGRSTQSKKTLLTTDIDSPLKNDLLKIATSWNHSIKSNSPKTTEANNNKGISNLTTTTSITTSLTHNGIKEMQNTKETSSPIRMKSPTVLNCSIGGRGSPSKDTISNSSVSPRSSATDTKSTFFSESPNTTTEVHLSNKEDSGFSSSASTSRPMSVSPC